MNNLNEIVQTVAVYAIPVLFAISLHEAAHGYTARYFGDPTASAQGRLSINPIRHIDLFGTILLPLLLYWAVGVPIGYAKPVPVDTSRLRNPKKQMGFVAVAGPMANFAMGLGWMVLLVLMRVVGVDEAFPIRMAEAGVLVNAAMCVFNLIPVPPLDGGRILTSVLPRPLDLKFAQIERYSLFIFFALVLLMQFHVLDRPLHAAYRFVIQLFVLLVSPLTLFLN